MANDNNQAITGKAAKQDKAAMPELPALPSLPRKGKAPRKCECGCQQLTRGGRFVPGHDAKVLAWAIRVERGVVNIEDTGCHRAAVERLIAKRASA